MTNFRHYLTKIGNKKEKMKCILISGIQVSQVQKNDDNISEAKSCFCNLPYKFVLPIFAVHVFCKFFDRETYKIFINCPCRKVKESRYGFAIQHPRLINVGLITFANLGIIEPFY
jgi:hypothetical protein